jgi:hypothetical protein
MALPIPNIFTDDQERFLEEAYIKLRVQPRDLVTRINKKFGTSFTIDQIYKKIQNEGYTKRRKDLIKATETALGQKSESNADIVRKSVRQHRETMERFVAKSEKVADKALDMASKATSARDLSAATGAARAAIGIYRQCSGMDGPGNLGTGNVFNFNFGQEKLTKQAEPVDV